MEKAFGFLLFLIGFLMLFAGIGLLIVGEIKFKSGKKIPRRAGRRTAIVFLCFFPLVTVAYWILQFADPGPESTVPRPAVYWPLALFCLGLGGDFARRGMNAGQARRSPTPMLTSTPFDVAQPADPAPDPVGLEFDMPAEPAPPPGPALGKPVRPKQRGQNPFDFS